MSVHFANDLLIYEIADVILVSSNVHLKAGVDSNAKANASKVQIQKRHKGTPRMHEVPASLIV